MRFISFLWIEADTIAILPPFARGGFSEDELVSHTFCIFRFEKIILHAAPLSMIFKIGGKILYFTKKS